MVLITGLHVPRGESLHLRVVPDDRVAEEGGVRRRVFVRLEAVYGPQPPTVVYDAPHAVAKVPAPGAIDCLLNDKQ